MSVDEYNAIQIPTVEPDEWEIAAMRRDEETIDDDGVDAFEFLKKL